MEQIPHLMNTKLTPFQEEILKAFNDSGIRPSTMEENLLKSKRGGKEISMIRDSIHAASHGRDVHICCFKDHAILAEKIKVTCDDFDIDVIQRGWAFEFKPTGSIVLYSEDLEK